jgi:hypothetical protein
LHSRVEVTDNVGDLGAHRGVDGAGEGVGEGGGDEDIGKGDALSDEPGAVKEDLLEGGEAGVDSVKDGGVDLSWSAGLLMRDAGCGDKAGGTHALVVGVTVAENGVGGGDLDHDLWNGQSRPDRQTRKASGRRYVWLTSWSAKNIHCWTSAFCLRSAGRMVWLGPSSATVDRVSGAAITRKAKEGHARDRMYLIRDMTIPLVG